MKHLAQIMPCSLGDDMAHDIGIHKFKRKKNPTETSFTCQLNIDARNILYIFLFHAFNAIGILVSKILEI